MVIGELLACMPGVFIIPLSVVLYLIIEPPALPARPTQPWLFGNFETMIG